MDILIAEDDLSSQHMLRALLTKWGYNVRVASNGNDAYKILMSRDSPPIVILDWIMPDLDGTEVCKRIREEKEDSYTYILLLTSKSHKDDRIEGMRAGADDYIVKPFDSEELKLRLKAGKRIIALEEQLNKQALYDQLTGLANRTLFTKRLKRLISRPGRHSNYQFAVLFMDLDRFKVINDSLGHAIGDRLLIEVSQRLNECLRSTDTASRFGGDEFAILLDDIADISDAEGIVKRIQKSIAMPYQLDGYEVFTTASIGISLSAYGYKMADEMIRDADSAMYKAKALGRSHYEVFEPQMHSLAVESLELEADLWRAVDRMEFEVHYQPIISMTSKSIKRVEALLRWKHPEKGYIPPFKFIPLAEETGLISTIGEWVLKTACEQTMKWHNAGHDHLIVDVNFSARQFHYQNLTGVISRALEETQLPARSLNVEITESVAMDKKSIKVMNEITDMGITTSIDDFGTGYSSLGSLKKFPITALKVDKSFIWDISVDPDVEAIVTAIIAMAHSLKMIVVAEGVETEDQLRFLYLNDCDEIQGYYYSPPVPAEKLTELLENEKGLPIFQR